MESALCGGKCWLYIHHPDGFVISSQRAFLQLHLHISGHSIARLDSGAVGPREGYTLASGCLDLKLLRYRSRSLPSQDCYLFTAIRTNFCCQVLWMSRFCSQLCLLFFLPILLCFQKLVSFPNIFSLSTQHICVTVSPIHNPDVRNIMQLCMINISACRSENIYKSFISKIPHQQKAITSNPTPRNYPT